jgi:hypothetical protein
MAFNLENMTIDYKKMLRMIPSDRATLAQSGAISDLISSLTPGQLANLFPRYYRDKLPDVGQAVSSLGGALSGGTNISGRSDGGGTYSPNTSKPLKSPSAEETAIQNLLHEAKVLGQDAAKPGTEGLEPGDQQRMKMTYDAFTAAGFSHKQSLALTAEVGRENGFQEKFMFGTHSDPYNNATNLGMLSMQGPRLTNLKEALKNEGRFDVNGELIRDQETMNAMARFYMTEMQTSENTKRTQEFLSNPDIDPQRAAELLGKGYIRWRYDDQRYAHHHDYRNRYYNQIDNITQQYVENIENAGDEINNLETVITKFDPAMIDQLDERMKRWYENAGEVQKKRFETALERLGVERFNEVMKNQPVNNATLQAVSVVGSSSEYVLTDKLGNITPNLRRYDPNVDDPGASAPGEFNYSLSQEGIQRFNLADETGRITPSSVEKNLVEIETNGGVKVKVHKDVAENTRAFLNGLEARGYPVRSADTAGYSFRGKNGGAGSGLSTHSTGTTFDINAGTNWGTMEGGNGTIDMPPDIEKLANYHGFSWGAKFGDPMHFETMSPELHAQKLKELEDQGYVQRRDDKIRAEAEAIAQADPVAAAQNNMQPSVPPTELPAVEIPTATVPALSTGGTVEMPPAVPGEGIAGVDMKTGALKFVGNDRELYTQDDQGNLRVDPSTIRREDQKAEIASAEPQRVETPNQPVQRRPEQPMPVSTPDSNFLETMSSGSMSSSPSQLRALNRAKLYGDNSGNLVNGHFS